MSEHLRSAEDVAREVVRMLDPEVSAGWPDVFAAQVEGVAALLTGWAGAIRADERGRVATIHNTLTDEALVAELVRRGVLREERVRDNRICRCNLHRADPLLYAPCDAHEPITLPTRYVTEWG